MSNEKKATILTSPIAEIQWEKLRTPDKMYNNYSVDLLLDPANNEEHKTYLATLSNILDVEADLFKKMGGKVGKSKPIRKDVDKEGVESGKIRVSFKKNAVRKDEATGSVITQKSPSVLDSELNPVQEDILVGNGSLGRVEHMVFFSRTPQYGLNVKLVPLSLQVTHLEEYSMGTSSSLSKVEGGFVAGGHNTTADDDLPF